MLLGYLNGLMLAGYVNPPARYINFETWMNVQQEAANGGKFCAASDSFFRSSIAAKILAPSQGSKALDAMVFEARVEDCYPRLLSGEVTSRLWLPYWNS